MGEQCQASLQAPDEHATGTLDMGQGLDRQATDRKWGRRLLLYQVEALQRRECSPRGCQGCGAMEAECAA